MSRIENDPSVPFGSRPVSAELLAAGVKDIRDWDLGWDDAEAPAAVLIAYDAELFEVGAFARHWVVMPASVRRSVKKRQAEFFMGRLAGGEAIAAFVRRGREHPSPMNRVLPQERAGRVEIGIGASREPLWPEGIVGSISHAGRYAAAVAARATEVRGIGIDIECRMGAQTRESVENTVLNPAEKTLLRGLAGEVPYEMLLTIAFSAKESFFKGCFATVGSYFDFDAVELTALDIAGGALELVLTRALVAPLPQGRRFTLRHQLIDADTTITSFVW